jgi:hypothetical protein
MGATTFSITTLYIMTLSIKGSFATLGMNNTQHTSIECRYAECCYAECRDYLNVMLRVVRPCVIMLNVVMLSVVAPLNEPIGRNKWKDRTHRCFHK